MTRVGLLLLLVSSVAFSGRETRTRENRRVRPFSGGFAYFEAFPASGAGTSGACSTTAPTGAKGEVLTFTRASNGTCTKTATGGLATTGIADGDLVVLSSNVARVEYDANGVLGLRVEGARTNSALRSQAFDNAAWIKTDGLGVTVTADQATAPDGTLTADRVQIASCAGSQSVFRQDTGVVSATSSVYVKGRSGSGSVSVCQFNNAANACTVCGFNAATWTRCIHAAPAAAGQHILVGCQNVTDSYPNGTNTGAADVYAWEADHEAGAFATSPSTTAGAAATRAVDVPSFPVTLSGSTFSGAVSYTPAALVSGATAFQVYVDANNSVTAFVSAAGKLTCTFRIGGVDSSVDSAASITANAVNRVACTYGAAGRSACLNGTCDTTAGALTMFSGAATFYPGTRQATGNEANGIVSRLCYDPADPRCIL